MNEAPKQDLKEYTGVRTDQGARKLVERMDTLTEEVHKLKAEVLRIIGSAGVLIVIAAYFVANAAGARGEKAAEDAKVETSARVAAVEASTAKKISSLETTIQAREDSHSKQFQVVLDELKNSREDAKGIYNYLLTAAPGGRRQPRLEKP